LLFQVVFQGQSVDFKLIVDAFQKKQCNDIILVFSGIHAGTQAVALGFQKRFKSRKGYLCFFGHQTKFVQKYKSSSNLEANRQKNKCKKTSPQAIQLMGRQKQQ
jgi:hypothetical protein